MVTKPIIQFMKVFNFDLKQANQRYVTRVAAIESGKQGHAS